MLGCAYQKQVFKLKLYDIHLKLILSFFLCQIFVKESKHFES